MAKRPGRSFSDFAGQTARIAEEGRQVFKATSSQPHEVTAVPAPPVPEGAAEVDPVSAVEAVQPQADEAVEVRPDEATASQPRASAKPTARQTKAAPQAQSETKAEKRSTSLYLSGGAMRALRMIAASEGVRPHRVVDDALRAHFKRKGYDFDALNAVD